jgi:hypothetical protein
LRPRTPRTDQKEVANEGPRIKARLRHADRERKPDEAQHQPEPLRGPKPLSGQYQRRPHATKKGAV